MGIIIPNKPTGPSDQADLGSSVAVLSAPEKPAGGPDANRLDRVDFPQRDPPPVNGPRDARYQVVFRQSVLDEIHAHGKSSMEAEVCGVLVGDIYSDRFSTWGYVQHCIRGNNAVAKQTQVTITSETWSRIHETLESKYPGKKIIGWYHTHPGFGIFLSGMDLFIQDNFFNQPWQVATVYDPHSGDEGTFIWREGKSQREPALVENDVPAGAAAQTATLDAVEQLTRRVKQLERRFDVILTGFLLLVLVALSAPLLLFALRPDVFRRLPAISPGTHSPKPAATPTPAVAPVASPAAARALRPATIAPLPPGPAAIPPLPPGPAAIPVNVQKPGGGSGALPEAAAPGRINASNPARTPILLKVDPSAEETTGGPRLLTPQKDADK